MKNQFDRLVKENLREPGIVLLRKLFGIDVADVQPLSSKLQFTIPEREADMLLKITTQKGRIFIAHIEWQTNNDPNIVSRMLLYHGLIYQTYKLEVLGFVVHMGKDNTYMKHELLHGRLSYSFELIDPRKLDPIIFLESERPEEIIFAILAGSNKSERREMIREIISKLQHLLKDDQAEFIRRFQQLEILSFLRDEQQIIKEEAINMALVLDITKDIRYKEGKEQGIEQGIEQGKAEEKEIFVKNLLINTDFEISKIANLADTSEALVEKVKKELPEQQNQSKV